MVKRNFKNIDILRRRRKTNYLVDPYFIDNKKYIKKGIFQGLIIIISSFIIGMPFIFRTKFLEDKKEKIKIFSEEYDLIEKKLSQEQQELNNISNFNNELKNSIFNINSSSALLQEIALIIPEDIQILDLTTKGDTLFLKAKIYKNEYLKILNSFLISLDESELVKFNYIDVKKIDFSENNLKENTYLVEIFSKVSTRYRDINEKYLTKLGSYGLLNRLNLLKNINKINDLDS
tara:strand:+ start:1769 stop:2467 length:699 start_codon:yes stop_codon:yes gene_type:complete